jgi:tetratricopeptide (TPR) repeat protein
MQGQFSACLDQLETLRAYVARMPEYQQYMRPAYLLEAEVLRRTGQVQGSERARSIAQTQAGPIWPDEYQDEVHCLQTGLKRHLIDADQAFGRADYEGSIDLLRQTIGSYPDSTWARILLSRSLIRTGAPDSQHSDRARRLKEAEVLLIEVLRVDPNSVEALYRLGVAMDYQSNYAESRSLYERALGIKPDFTMAYFNLSHCLLRLGDLDGAIEALEGLVRIEPDHLAGRIHLGELLLQANRADHALRHLEMADKLKPHHRSIQSLLGRARQQVAANAAIKD